jgi:hypothetical protein
MPYIENRSVHDADAHVVETPDWLHGYADPADRARLPQLYLATVKPGEETLIEACAGASGSRISRPRRAGDPAAQELERFGSPGRTGRAPSTC